MVFDLPKILSPDGFYDHQTPFDSGKVWHAQTPFELVHIDLCSINKPLLVDIMYIMTFIDDFSRFIWIYLLINKSRVIERFKEF